MSAFSQQLIAWQRQHGRHDLPWQHTRDPYAVWVSEIMLQQTQVVAVIPYYQRFMQSFPNIASLASAEQDQVLQHWSGLGYYSRARNLHHAANIIMQQHGGVFPQTVEAVKQLRGIGRSTAAAILAFAHGQRHAILDGNVKRVLTRFLGIEGWPGQSSVENALWQAAERLLPDDDIESYTQGMMDLGATLCTRSKPNCGACPLAGDCVAYQSNLTAQIPTPKPRKPLPEKQITMLVLVCGHDIFLEKRPSIGIWGGLWSLPEVATEADVRQAALQRYGLTTELLPALPTLVHTFTHFRLHITPQPLNVIQKTTGIQQAHTLWLAIDDAMGAALPAAVRTLLNRYRQGE